LANKVALITGASSGIGKAITFALAKEGMKVAVVARSLDPLIALKEGLQKKKADVFPLAVDLRDISQIHVAFEAVRRQWGGVDVLINSAGLGHDAPLVSGSDDHFKEMLEVNVLALAIATKEAVKDMQKRKVAGQIVNISSMSAYRVQYQSGMYAATKHAVRALTEGVRQELRAMRSPIRVSSISPGNVDTMFLTRMLGSKKAAKKARPLFKHLESTDIAETVLHILKTPPHVEIHDVLVRPTEQPD